MELKELPRKGWVDRGVTAPESVADHSYGLALLAWALARARGIDAGRAALIALIHDLPEAEVGDETPFDHLPDRDPRRFELAPPDDPARRTAKESRERAAAGRLAESLPPQLGAELRALWEEYAAGESAEARLVKQLDRVETLLQAERYATRQPGLAIGSFRAQVAAMALPADLAALVRPE
jgi:putative hydrolase of HD superfamily